MSTTTIPKQHYVTIQYRGKDVSMEDGHLGFASPYTKDAAFKKRKSTQDSWAYGSGTTVTIDENDDITVTGSGRQGGYGNMEVDSATLFMTNCYPIIINNETTDGFQISKSVKRGGGWNATNIVWRIADPRGFELEISSANFAAVVCCTTIINGVIQGKCLWGRNGKDNILLPEASSVYQEASALATKIDKKLSLKDVQIGDWVELLNPNIYVKDEQNVKEFQYLGKYFMLSANNVGDDNYSRSGNINFNTKQPERYILRTRSGKYISLSTPKIADVTEKIAIPLDKADIAKEITAWLSVTNGFNDFNELILVSPNKIKPETVVTELEPVAADEVTADGMWKTGGRHNSAVEAVICHFDGLWYVSSQDSKWVGGRYVYTPTLTRVKVDRLKENILTVESTTTTDESHYWSRRTVCNLYTRKDFTFDEIEMYRAKVTANGITGKVHKLGYL